MAEPIRGKLYFATSNTRLRRLGATAVAAEFVNRRMNRSRSRRVVLLLDCCYAGAFERGMSARAGEVHLVARRPDGAFPWIVAVLGAAGAASR